MFFHRYTAQVTIEIIHNDEVIDTFVKPSDNCKSAIIYQGTNSVVLVATDTIVGRQFSVSEHGIEILPTTISTKETRKYEYVPESINSLEHIVMDFTSVTDVTSGN